jgi:3-oxoadipate enol-lactonase
MKGYASITGAQLYYELQGEGLPLVLLHGGDFDLRMWDDQFETLSQSYQVLRYDARGHGQSTATDVPFRYSDDLKELLEFLNISQAVVLGLSFGGGAALDFSLQYPDLVKALILVACAPSGFEFTSEPFKQFEAAFEAAFAQEDLALAVEVYLKTWVDGPLRSPEQVNPVMRKRLQENLVVAFKMPEPPMPESLEPNALSRLGDVKIPTLIIQGDHDLPDLLMSAELLAKQIPGAQKFIIPNAAHMVNMEYPLIFNREVTDFLKRNNL